MLSMKSLKEIEAGLKPRKVINRLPDIDMWMVCEDRYVEEAKKELRELFDELDMHTSDVDPVQSIKDFKEYFAEYKLSDIKILDYLLWNSR